MRGRIELAPLARQDLIECAERLEQEASYLLGERLLLAAERSLAKLGSNPAMGWPHASPERRLAGIRTWRIEGFEQHLIFYRACEGGILVLRVPHGSRDIPAQLNLGQPEE